MPGDPLLNEGDVTVGHVVARQVSVESDASEELTWKAVPICKDDHDSDDEHTVGQINSTWAIGGALPPGLDAGWVYCEFVRFGGEACTGYLARGDLVSVLTVSIPKRSAEQTRALFDRLVTDAAARLMAA